MKIKYLIVSLSFLIGIGVSLHGQETTEIKPSGVVFPRLTTYPVGPDSGQVIFYQPSDQFEYWDGTTWSSMTSGGAAAGDIIEDGVDNDTYVKALEFGSQDRIEIEVEGTNTMNILENEVFINRPNSISSSESFGVRTTVSGASYGGMYIETNGNLAGKPFYGMAINGVGQSWMYHDGGSDEIRFYNAGDRFSISNSGVVEINNSYTLPNTNGSANQVLTADGSGAATWEDLAGSTGISDADNDTKITAIENGTNDYIDFVAEGSSGHMQLWKCPNGELRIELTGVTNSTVIGNNAGLALTSAAFNNVFYGEGAGATTNTGDDNTIIGTFSGNNNSSGSRNTYMGRRTAYSNNGIDNTIIGYRAATNGSSNYNTIIGSEALENMDNGSAENVVIGRQAGESADMTSYSVLLGYQAGQLLNDGYNVMIGYQAGQNQNNTNQVMKDNVMIGFQAGQENDGNRNVYIGKQAGVNNQGDGNIYLGNNCGGIQTGESNRLRIANNSTAATVPLIFGEFDNQMVGINVTNAQAALQVDANTGDDALRVRIGGTTKFMVHDNGRVSVGSASTPSYAMQLPNNPAIGTGWAAAYGWHAFSDGRVKSMINEVQGGLDLIKQLRPVTYRHHASTFENGELEVDQNDYALSVGFVAQELKAVIPELANRPENEEKHLWTIDYARLAPYLTKAIQEQNLMIELLQKENRIAANKLEKLESELAEIKALIERK